MLKKYEVCPGCNQSSLNTTDEGIKFCCNPDCDEPDICPYCNQKTLILSESGEIEFCNNPICRGGVDE
jgi:hypothetical protein